MVQHGSLVGVEDGRKGHHDVADALQVAPPFSKVVSPRGIRVERERPQVGVDKVGLSGDRGDSRAKLLQLPPKKLTVDTDGTKAARLFLLQVLGDEVHDTLDH